MHVSGQAWAVYTGVGLMLLVAAGFFVFKPVPAEVAPSPGREQPSG
ncbi:hypothetical protein [Intrasporangium sp.]